MGHDGFWIVEDLWNRGAVPLAAACVAATERVRIGVGVVNPYTRHPTLFAMDYGVMAELSGGRVILGIGSSVQAWVEMMGLEYRLPRTSVAEAIMIARQLLAGQECAFNGKAFSIDRIRLNFPIDYPTPLYMGAMGERTVRTCGELADGWVVSLLEPLGYMRQGMRWLREGIHKAGRQETDVEVVQYFPFCCADDSAVAKRDVKPLLALFLAGEFGLYEQQEPVMRSLRDFMDTVSPEEYREILRRLSEGADPTEVIPDALVDELAIAGTPEECAERLREFAAVGVTEAALLPAAMDVEVAAKAIGKDIRPLLQ
jgi:5,10-methylenetetrahydromethanopterin reductase